MISGHHKYLLLLESEYYLESKMEQLKRRPQVHPKAAIKKFLIKAQILENLFCNVVVLHLCSALLACFSRF